MPKKTEIFCTVQVNGKPLELKVDMGDKCNVIPETLFTKANVQRN